LGSEEVANGDFALPTTIGWSDDYLCPFSVENNMLKATAQTTGSGMSYQINGLTIGAKYVISWDYINGSGALPKWRITNSDQSALKTYSDNNNSFYFIPTATTVSFSPLYQCGTLGTFYFDNVSVKQLDPDDDWTLGTGWSLEDGKASCDGTQVSASVMYQDCGIVSGNQYQVVYTMTSYTAGSVRIFLGGTSAGAVSRSASGTYTQQFTAGGNQYVTLEADASFIGSVTDISIKDVTFSEDVDLPRIDYTGGVGHILLEPASTNLVTYSEDFTQWGNARTTDTSNQATSPDGTNNATYLEQNSGQTTAGSVYLSSTISSGTNTLSVFAKKKEKDFIVLYDSNTARTYFDLNNGSIGTTPSGVTANIENYGNGWYRCSATFTASSSGSQNSAFYLADNDSAAPIADSGGIYIYGAQLEELSYATSYIPTHTGTTVTRDAETLDGSGNDTLINSTEGVLYAEISKAQTDNDDYILISLNDGTDSDDVVTVGFDSDDDFFIGVRTSASYDWLYNATTATANTFYKMAIRYKSGDIKAYIDGSPISPSSGSDGASFTFGDDLDNLSFDFGGNNPFYGKVKCLAVFDEVLEDDELEILTGTSYASFELLAAAGSYTVI